MGDRDLFLGDGIPLGYMGYLGEGGEVYGFVLSDGINLGSLGSLGYLERQIGARDL